MVAMLTTTTYSEVGETLKSTPVGGSGRSSGRNQSPHNYSYRLCISGTEKESAAAWLAAAMSAMSSSPMASGTMLSNHQTHHQIHSQNHQKTHQINQIHHNKQPALVGVVAAAANLKVTLSLESSLPSSLSNGSCDTLLNTCSTPSTPLPAKETGALRHGNNDDCILTFDPKTMSVYTKTTNNNSIAHININNNDDYCVNNNINGVSQVSTPAVTIDTPTKPVPIQTPTRRLSRPLTPPKVEQLNIDISPKTTIEPKITGISPPSDSLLREQSTKPAKPLLPFGGREDKVRRTSILRPPAHYLEAQNYAKKNVRFADAMGLALENVRLFSTAPQVSRRYSSYNAPTARHCEFDSPWNMALGQNRAKESISSFSYSSPYSSFSWPNVNHNAVCSPNSSSSSCSSKRYDLVPLNFTSPTMQLNFEAELERQSVMLHSLTCAETTIYGTVSVVNRHFDKHVFVRYSFNEWQTYIEREAAYMLGSHDGRTDKFSFAIYARPEDFQAPNGSPITGKLHFAICFKTGDGLEAWDNNHDRNYTLNLIAH